MKIGPKNGRVEKIPKVGGKSRIKFWKRKNWCIFRRVDDLICSFWCCSSICSGPDQMISYIPPLFKNRNKLIRGLKKRISRWPLRINLPKNICIWSGSVNCRLDADPHLMQSMERSKCLIKRIQKNRDLIAIGPFDWWEIQMFDRKKPEEQRSVSAIRLFDWLW